MRHPFAPPVIRLRVGPDDPPGAPPRPRGARRPHSDERVAQVRRLIEQTTLSYGEIAKRAGVGCASICRWTRDGGWQRPAFAPRATDTIPRPRAGQKLKLRLLAGRLTALAERYVRELEQAESIDPDKLMQALEILKMARLEAMGRRRRRRIPGDTHTGAQWLDRQDAIRTALRELRRGGVDIDRAPQEAIDDFIESHTPVEDEPALREKGRRAKR